ncbi:MAG: NAD(P)/FAD-dependent oxidoreductase [Saprospiraceae bacterium]|nr:NAD(P)/FAD-dependent oxidoreductase [Saprospiraceae bacterium]
MKQQHHQIVIIGAGTAGITVAAQLLRKDKHLDIAIIDPASKHYYQPAWTLVGAGTFDFDATERDMKDLIPRRAKWIKDYVETVDPDNNKVITRDGSEITYDYLVACPGVQMDIDALPGLREALETDSVCSNYTDPKHTWKVLQNFKGGNAIFTQPATAIKCGGAPQKIMYLAEEYFHKSGVRDKTKVAFVTPGSVIFGTEPFKQTLMEIVDRKKIQLRFFHKITRIDPINKIAYFTIAAHADEPDKLYYHKEDLGEKLLSETEVAIPYDFLHLAPPQSAPDFIKKSKLVYQEGPDKGWINVDINTLQHKVYPNVFSLGDAAALPTAKTGAAIRKQAPVVVENLFHVMHHDAKLDPDYTGYSSCPIVTGYGKMLLAEFKYDNIRDSDPLISKFVDTSKEQYSMWLLKKYGLPFMYWNLMLKGKA